MTLGNMRRLGVHHQMAVRGHLSHAHTPHFDDIALLTLEGVQLAGVAFGLNSKQAHLSLALGTGQQRFNSTQFGRLSH
jgi:hypothetical protein